ncbi:MAG: DNA repair protein RadA [Chitinophagales bacterium]|nr:DNA repair protein RadA [Chitinophagales bacterium]MDW8273099.1 DNA repair protein RadA [Chitinophagales bacterium]
MSKSKIVFVCQNCGATAAKWMGKCPVCNEWNTYAEESIAQGPGPDRERDKLTGFRNNLTPPTLIGDIPNESTQRIDTLDPELNRVLGGGIVPGSIVLLGGDPGIGKSTLLLQLALNLKNKKILYVSGEESMAQISMRASRIGIKNHSCYIYTETNTQSIFKYTHELQPDLIIIDSIQTLQTSYSDSPPGSLSQLRECTSELQRLAKDSGIAVFIIGHITKEGLIAGPKVLEHIVDVVLQFEGEKHYAYRMLRTIKNRFGSTLQLGIYEMQHCGLRPVLNPSEVLLTQRDENLSGIAIASTMEGDRPLLIETQALVSPAFYGTPQRSATGFDSRRLSMLLAVLEKRVGFSFGTRDVFLNMAGGLQIEDPAVDLAIVAALLSSYEDIPVSNKSVFIGEVGLSGEVRAVSRIEQRISEAAKLGFNTIYISKYNMKIFNEDKDSLNIIPLGRVQELSEMLFSK